MPVTYTLIASNTLSSSAASVTFSAIPGTYTDLVLRMSMRNDNPSINIGVRFTINNLSTAIYSYTTLRGLGSSGTASSRETGFSFLADINGAGSSATANTFSSNEIYIPNYAGSARKVASIYSTNESNDTAVFMTALAGLIDTTSAINRFDISNGSTFQFVSGSSFFLYGIKNS